MATDEDQEVENSPAAAHRAELAAAPSFFIPPPFAWSDQVTGRKGWKPSFELIAFGMYVKRARYLARTTQTRVEELSGVDQGQISRLERGLAPTCRVEDLVLVGKALGRALPLGFCPHEHWCEWQPAPPPPPPRDWLAEAREFNARLGITPGE
jgi:transcriptional regulator with XRE-family HTH domain